jgi:hypothetical protein
MATISIPTLKVNEAKARVEDPALSLEYHLRILKLMERQLHCGENIELPEQILDQWRETLFRERALIEKFEKIVTG